MASALKIQMLLDQKRRRRAAIAPIPTIPRTPAVGRGIATVLEIDRSISMVDEPMLSPEPVFDAGGLKKLLMLESPSAGLVSPNGVGSKAASFEERPLAHGAEGDTMLSPEKNSTSRVPSIERCESARFA